MAGNYYGCTAKHAEFTCLSEWSRTRKSRRAFTREKWCEKCRTSISGGGEATTHDTKENGQDED